MPKSSAPICRHAPNFRRYSTVCLRRPGLKKAKNVRLLSPPSGSPRRIGAVAEEIEALITRLERGQLRDGDAQLLARLLRLLLCLILHPDPRKTGRLNLTELEEALLRLPRARWPLGRVLAVAENSLRSKGDDEEIARGLKELKKLLESHKVRVDLWPS